MAKVQYKTLNDIINTENRYDVNGITIFTKTEDGDLIIRDTDLLNRILQRILLQKNNVKNMHVNQNGLVKTFMELLNYHGY